MSEEIIPKSTLDAVCASLNYHHAQTKVKHCSAEREAAWLRLEKEQIRCRAYELECQHEPLAGLLIRGLGIEVGAVEYEPARKMMIEAARFVVFGRCE